MKNPDQPPAHLLPHAQGKARANAILSGVATLLLATSVLLPASPPNWWQERGALDPRLPAHDYAAINQGQLKNLARAAFAELEENLRHGAGPEIAALIASWDDPNHRGNDFAPVTVAELKAIARLYYDRLIAERIVSHYPWEEPSTTRPGAAESTTPDERIYVNQGQVKYAFDFRLDTDGDDLPDWWEKEQFFGLEQSGDNDPDGDGWNNALEFKNNQNPILYNQQVEPPAQNYSLQLVITSGNGQVLTEGEIDEPLNALVLLDNQPVKNLYVKISSEGAVDIQDWEGEKNPNNPISILSASDGVVSTTVKNP